MKPSYFVSLSQREAANTEGGFVPLVIAGYYITANTVATVSGIAAGSILYALTH